MRIACICVPSFPLAAWLRVDPELRGAPVVVTDAPGPRGRIVACAPEAEQRGVATGLTAAQAAAIAGDLVVRPASPAAEHAAQAALCDVAYSCSPRVEEGGMGTVYCDADGLRELYASEAELARGVASRARALGLAASVGIAATKIAAQLAARDGGGCAVIPPHAEWRFLAPVPIHLLDPSPALRETLARWGIRTLGDLGALPASAVATRLGPAGAQLARRARGEDEHPLAPRPLPLHFEETAELDYGVDALEPFLFVARGLLDRLTARLALRGLICGDLRLALGLAGRGRDERTVAVSAPSNEIKPLLTLIRLHLEAHPPVAAVETVRLAAVPERLRAMQLDLFRPAGPAPAQLAATLARLAALCGADRLGAPAVADSHRPEAYQVREFSTPSSVTAADNGATKGTGASLALRALRPPRALAVFCNRDQPDFVRPAEAVREEDCAYGCHGRVVTLAGPWRVQGEWWRPDAFHRDYYDAQLSDGVVYRLFFDRAQQQWFVDGVYD
jgi:protein ImuB